MHLLLYCTVATNTQQIDKLSQSYMFRHYCVIFRELVFSTLPS